MTTTKKPTLTDREAMGGVIAEDGFSYQRFDALTRIPGWLVNPAFEALLLEGFEDYEARFFCVHATEAHVLERYQAKSNDLGPADVREIFEKFHAFEEAYPRRARLHSLVTPRLPAKVAWIARDPERVRRARPFYAPFADVTAAIDSAVRQSFLDEYDVKLGNFVASNVEVREQNLPDRTAAVASFGQALLAAYPSFDFGARAVDAAFTALLSVFQARVGQPIGRREIQDVLERALGVALPKLKAFPLRVRSDRNGSDESAVEIDASEFSGAKGYPASAVWQSGLHEPLAAASDRLHGLGESRVALSGSFRLSTGFVLGHAFRAARGFELEIQTRAGVWMTDDHPDGSIESRWKFAPPKGLHNGELVAVIGVVNDPLADVLKYTKASADAVFSAFLPEGISSSRMAQVGVTEVKRALAASVAALHPSRVRLFFLGPAAFAVALGHRWNALPPTVLHELDASTRTYVETAQV